MRERARKRGIRLAYIDPGKPQQNAYVKRFSWTVRHGYLEMNKFRKMEEARQLAEQCVWTYNNERLHGDRRHHTGYEVKVDNEQEKFLFQPPLKIERLQF